MKRDYERLSIEDFGRALITSRDLDPVYWALHEMTRREVWNDEGQLRRWLVAYWCFYHCGVASFLSEHEGSDFWEYMRIAAENVQPSMTHPLGPEARWERGGERRHFRGQQATLAVAELRERYPQGPEVMVDYITGGESVGPRPFYVIADRVREHRGFGNWISFKVADMVDRLGIEPVSIEQAEIFMYDDPLKAAKMLWRQKQGLPENAEPKDLPAAIKSVVDYLTEEFSDLQAPPMYERAIGLQEVETCLCKWKSHLNGHYPLLNDTTEIAHGLQSWVGVSETATQFRIGLTGESA